MNACLEQRNRDYTLKQEDGISVQHRFIKQRSFSELLIGQKFQRAVKNQKQIRTKVVLFSVQNASPQSQQQMSANRSPLGAGTLHHELLDHSEQQAKLGLTLPTEILMRLESGS